MTTHFGVPHTRFWFAATLFLATLMSLGLTASAQRVAVNRESSLEAEIISNQRRIAEIDVEAVPVAAQLQSIQQQIERHNQEQPDRTDHAAVAAYNRRSDELNREKGGLIARLKALEEEQDRLKARNGAIAAAAEAVVRREQAEFDAMNQAWLRQQEILIRQRAESDRAWQRAVFNSLNKIQVPVPIPSKPVSLDDLLPGDVLLFEPEKGWNSLIPPLDYLYRVAEDLADGDVYAAIGRRPSPVSHALTFVKRSNGVLIFLDHTNEGSRMIDSHQLAIKYKNRSTYVARPIEVPDGRMLWSAAKEAAARQKPYFGVLPGQRVCSEQVCVLIAKSSDMVPGNHRLGPIDITPADFFDEKATGKYFIVSRLER